MEKKMVNKSEMIKVVESYVANCLKYDDRKNASVITNELFGDFTCGQLESMVKLFDCVLHTDYFTKEITDTVTLNEAEVERMKRFIRCEQSKDRAKFIILNILDGTCYGFNHAMYILNGLKVENIKLNKLYSIFKLFVDAYNNYYKEEIEEKVNKENSL